MSDLVEFLRARLAEDEEAARAATLGPWRHDPNKHHHIVGTPLFEEAVFAGPRGADAVCVAGTGETGDQQSMRDARHIARHDPARVLRQIETTRRIIDEHQPERNYVYRDDGTRACGTCGDGTFEWPCLTLRLLALPYADHRDYRQEWML